MDAEVRELLEKAYAEVQRGWCKRFYRDNVEKPTMHCMVGALLDNAKDKLSTVVTHACDELAGIINEQYPGIYNLSDYPARMHPSDIIIVNFNDDGIRTHAEVLAIFEKALAKE